MMLLFFPKSYMKPHSHELFNYYQQHDQRQNQTNPNGYLPQNSQNFQQNLQNNFRREDYQQNNNFHPHIQSNSLPHSHQNMYNNWTNQGMDNGNNGSINNQIQNHQNMNTVKKNYQMNELKNKQLNNNNNFNNNNNNNSNKSGWICSNCQNFNYEMRVKCNRCSKPHVRYMNVNNNANNDQMYIQNNNVNNFQLNNQNQNQSNIINQQNKFKLCQLQQQEREREINNLTTTNNNNTNNLPNLADLISYINQNYPNSNLFSNSNTEKQSTSKQFDPSQYGSNKSSTSTDPNTPNNIDDINLTPTFKPAEILKETKEKDKKKKKPFVERVGDWVCIKCKNLNFSFRLICNRCQLTKIESEKLFEKYMNNLMNYVKLNDGNQGININQVKSNDKGNVLTSANLNALSQLGNLRTLSQLSSQLSNSKENTSNTNDYYTGENINELEGSN